MNYLMYWLEGGQARKDGGKVLGMVLPDMNSCFIMSSRVGLYEGSPINILEMRSLAASDIWTCSGKL